jgi:hypothetical protein
MLSAIAWLALFIHGLHAMIQGLLYVEGLLLV